MRKSLPYQGRWQSRQALTERFCNSPPYFFWFYNTLGSIHQLCLEQPEQAAQLTLEFSQYLRGSLGELNIARPISILKEMEHVRHYVHIEEVRFPDITVRFDLRCTSFLRPDSRSYALDTEKVDCDYYDYLLRGSPPFMGSYMSQYS